MTAMPLLEISNLHISFNTPRGVLEVVNGVNLDIAEGEIHGVVGESGSGKSVTARSVLGLLPRGAVHEIGGEISYRGRDLLALSERVARREIRGREISMVFQDPMTALNPVMKIGKQIALSLRHHEGLSKKEAAGKAEDLLHQVGMPRPKALLSVYPHQLSGGQRQRVMIAIALSCDPSLLIADEPTTALDVTVQAQILDLFESLRESRGLAILLVSHDLSLIAERCDRTSVMYAGRILERGPADQLFAGPRHPYTHLLELARPSMDDPPHTPLRTISGLPPDLSTLSGTCTFMERCPYATEECVEEPDLADISLDRMVRCWNPLASPVDATSQVEASEVLSSFGVDR